MLSASARAAGGEADYASRWQELIGAEDFARARSLCEGWLESDEKIARVEAHKCLANIEFAGSRGLLLEQHGEKADTVRPGFGGPGIDRALGHLDDALELDPSDVSVHQGRIFILRASGRLDEVPAYLEKSVLMYRGPDALDVWLGTLYPLFEEERYAAAVKGYKVLEEHYPDSAQVAANLGALYALLEKDGPAREYLEKSVTMAPDDPINNWNLARFYDFSEDLVRAEEFYLKSISLEKDPDKRRWLNCVFAEFVSVRLEDDERACRLQMEYCPESMRGACRD